MDTAFLTLNFVTTMILAAVWVLRILPIRGEYITTIMFLMGLGLIYENMVVKLIVFVVLLGYVYTTRKAYAAFKAADNADFERRFGKQPAN